MIGCSLEFIECRIAEWIWRICPLTLLVVGTVGNVINVVILSRRTFRRYSTSVYLITLAVSDTLALWTVLPESTSRFFFGVDYLSITEVHCKFTSWIAYSSAAMSSWTVVHLTIERVMYSVNSKTKPSRSLSFKIAIATAFIIQFFTVHLIFGHTMQLQEEHGLNVTLFSTRKQCSLVTQEYRRFINTSWNYIVLVSFNIVPMLIIISGNAVIGISLFKRKNRIFPQSNVARINLTREKRAVKMLLAICCFYISCTSPYCVYFVVKSYSTKQLTTGSKADDALINAVIHVLLLSNFTFNFAMYFARGTLFRREWSKMLWSFRNRISAMRLPRRQQTHTNDIYMIGMATE